MDALILKSHAKVNLTLDIVGKREDGYHEVAMIMQSIALADKLKFKRRQNGIFIKCNIPYIPKDERNIVFKTARLLKERYNVSQGIEVYIQKKIPVSAGLAGGSANAAATLIALNEIWSLNLSRDDLFNLASQIGADVPFCLLGGTALAKGIGEELTPIAHLPKFYMVLVKPRVSVSTAWAYSLIKLDQIKSHPDNNKMIKAIESKEKEKIASLLGNVFEQFIFEKHPELVSIKEKLIQLGAMGALMSGSGPTIYGLFKDKISAQKAYKALEPDGYQVFLSETYNGGGNGYGL